MDRRYPVPPQHHRHPPNYPYPNYSPRGSAPPSLNNLNSGYRDHYPLSIIPLNKNSPQQNNMPIYLPNSLSISALAKNTPITKNNTPQSQPSSNSASVSNSSSSSSSISSSVNNSTTNPNEPKTLMFNHKHLQYVPKKSHLMSMSNGQQGQMGGGGRSGGQNNTNPYPLPLKTSSRDRIPLTKNIGVGANLNFSRQGNVDGLPHGPQNSHPHPNSHQNISPEQHQHQQMQQQQQHHHHQQQQQQRLEISQSYAHAQQGFSHGQNGPPSHHSSQPHHHSPHSSQSQHSQQPLFSPPVSRSISSSQPSSRSSSYSHPDPKSSSKNPNPKNETSSSTPLVLSGGPTSLTSEQMELFSNPKPNSGQRIVSQNLNTTLSVTGVPSNDSELQLFRVLQRANLLNYFDVMIELGGDDVQQLCDAGEEEFLEIMALIGMASKPLHVRRLQKSLQEWITQPSLFPGPILGPPLSSFSHGKLSLPPPSSDPKVQKSDPDSKNMVKNMPSVPIRPIPYHPKVNGNLAESTFQTPPSFTLSNGISVRVPPEHSHAFSKDLSQNLHNAPVQNAQISQNAQNAQNFQAYQNAVNAQSGYRRASNNGSPVSNSSDRSSSPIPFLQDYEIEKITESAQRVLQNLPEFMLEPKVSSKRKTSADFESLMRVPESSPHRMDEVRKYAAIYGRYDCKRKVQKPLTIHELALNEAASQLTKEVPPLLTRREDLLTLSRQVVRGAGLPYSSIISSNSVILNKNFNTSDSQDFNRPRSAPDSMSSALGQIDDISHQPQIRPVSGPAVIETISSIQTSNESMMPLRKRALHLSPLSDLMGGAKERRIDLTVEETEEEEEGEDSKTNNNNNTITNKYET